MLKLKIFREKGKDVIEGDATRLPYKNNTFDFATIGGYSSFIKF